MRKSSQWWRCRSVPEKATHLRLSRLDRRQLEHSETLIDVKFSFCLHGNIWERKTWKMAILYHFFPKNRTRGKMFLLQKMFRIVSSIYDNNLNCLSCKITKLKKTQFCWEPYFFTGRLGMMLAFWNFSKETVILRMLSSTSLKSFVVLGWSRCNSWTFSKEQPKTFYLFIYKIIEKKQKSSWL